MSPSSCRALNTSTLLTFHPPSVKDREAQIVDALKADLGRPFFEAGISEFGWVENDIVFATRNLHKWVKDEKAQDIDLLFKPMTPKIRKDPLGSVLIIGYGIFCPYY